MSPSGVVPPFRVAIVGGGIGGLLAALFLHHFCGRDVEIAIYEQASQYKEIGAGVGIGVNAVRLLHKIGLGDATAEISGDKNDVWISFRRFDDSREIITVPADTKQKIRQYPVHRAEFLDLLVNAINERQAATLWTSKQCRSVIDNGADVTVRFADNTTADADLVVGCDGIHSAIRSQFLADHPQYSGRIAWRGLIPIADVEPWWPLESYSASWLGIDKHLLTFPVSRNRLLNIVAFVTAEESTLGDLRESWTATGNRDDLAADFADFNPTVRRIIDLMPKNPTKWKLHYRDLLDQWVFFGGKVVLMGDAAHAMLPHQGITTRTCTTTQMLTLAGAGAGQSIEDGYILGRVLQDYLQQARETDDLEPYMHLYQQVRVPRAHRAQATARQAGDVYEMQTDDMIGKKYDDCLPIVRDQLRDRMRWMWSENLDQAYETTREDFRKSR